MAKKYWLFKSEPGDYSIDDLKAEKSGAAVWDGVRNYQARNLMRDEMSPGDGVLFYHSNADPSAVVGLARIVETGVPDPSAFDPSSKYHDPKSDPDEPRWITVRIGYEAHLPRILPLSELREVPALADMLLLRKGMRLSVQPVSAAEWKAVMAQAKKKAPEAPARKKAAGKKVGKKKAGPTKKAGKKKATARKTARKKAGKKSSSRRS